MFWVMDVVIVVMTVSVVSLVLWEIRKDTRAKRVQYIEIGPYQEYETAPSINERWQDEERIGWPCNYCGLDDCSIVTGHPVLDDAFFISISGPKCKWCAELHNINMHLATHGVRRWQKG